MWMIDPALMCNKHLLGEHGEIHKFLPSFRKKVSITGRMSPVVQIEPLALKARHDELAAEMLRRWPKSDGHASPLDVDVNQLFHYLPPAERNAKVDVRHSHNDLISRCPLCRERIQSSKEK
jgi:hypothetical protein